MNMRLLILTLLTIGGISFYASYHFNENDGMSRYGLGFRTIASALIGVAAASSLAIFFIAIYLIIEPETL